jgi:hypothetical protein
MGKAWVRAGLSVGIGRRGGMWERLGRVGNGERVTEG